MTERLYIHVKNWDRYQPRSDRPNLPWLRLHTSLLGDDAWLELEPADKTLLITIWMLSQRYGNGCVIASLSWLQSQANLPLSNRYRGLKRLNDAGFIALSTTKGTPTLHPDGGLEERRGTTSLKKREERASGAAENGAPTLTEEEKAALIAEMEVRATEAGFHP